MKINRVGNVEADRAKSSVSTKKNNVTSPLYNNVSTLNAHSAALGRSQVSFGIRSSFDFEPEINIDYFKLPAGCMPDKYQIEAAKHLHMGKDVLVTAPTGTGKTAIAQYIISKNLKEGKRSFYTTPLKALSNQKLKEFREVYDSLKAEFGEHNVGLITGDVKINPDAKVVVMTTEIYNNMLGGPGKKVKGNEPSNQLRNLGTVIYDELHYIGDIDRGGVWEQSIMKSGHTQLLSLSATIGNSKEVAEWMSKVKHRPTNLVDVPAENRHVPLSFHNDKVYTYNPKAPFASFQSIVQDLSAKEHLPAAFFIYSKRKIHQALDSFKTLAQNDPSFVLTTKEEQKEIQKVVDKYAKNVGYLGEGLDFEALKYGYAPHNSGLLPLQKELIEELGQAKLVKVILSTDTLGAGINFPIRSAVMTSTRKPVALRKLADGDDGKRQISVNEFHQQAGRAGRRRLDARGYIYTTPETKDELKVFAELIGSAPDPLKSSYAPTYSEIADYHRHTADTTEIKKFFKGSFMAYDKSKDVISKNAEKLFGVFKGKSDILKRLGFLTAENTLSAKGILLSKLNGYAQIPVIEAVFGKKLPISNPIQFASAVASLSTISEAAAEQLKRQQASSVKIAPKNADNIESSIHKIMLPYEKESPELASFVYDMDVSLAKHNGLMKQMNPTYEQVAQNKDTVARIHDWAKLNSNSDDAIMNWKAFYKANSSLIDEGGMFGEIYKTTNLLKQIEKMAQKALVLPEFAEHKNYYELLISLAQESIKLVDKESIFKHLV